MVEGLAMLLKRGVRFANVSPPLYFAMGVAEVVLYLYSPTGFVVTSLDDSSHKETSLHYSKNSPDKMCRAFDVRTRSMKSEEIAVVHRELREFLSPLGFDVVLEVDHIHVEFDPKEGRGFIFRECS